ncbi:MAG: hypothetical protein AB7F89_28025, partial [Pirellulaceae bacterium]
MRFDTENGFQLEPAGENEPFLQLRGASAMAVAADFGGLLRLSAADVAFDFGAFADDGSGGVLGGPFLEMGEIQVALGNVDDVDNPLAGLGGSAGNFAIGWIPDADLTAIPPQVPFEFYQRPGFFVSLTLPENSGFGLPDWLPLNIQEIGLRFPDAFGDLLPNGGGQGDLAKFAFDALTNFSIVFSGGLQGTDGGWPITFEVDDAEVNVDLLAQYARAIVEEALKSVDASELSFVVNDPADLSPEDGIDQITVRDLVLRDGPLAGVRALGPRMLTIFGVGIE